MNSALDIVNAVIVATGIPSIILGMIYLGRKLEKLDTMDKTMEIMKQNLKVVCDFLTKDNKNFNPSELLSYSPFALSDNGFKFIRDIGFDQVFSEHKQDFYDFIESEGVRVKYDIETSAIKSISVLSDKEYMTFLKIFFYNNPTRNMQNTAPTLGIFVRDQYLEDHPQITV